jgi:hypothetical protein
MAKSPRWTVWEQLPNGEWVELGRTMFKQSAKLLAMRHDGPTAIKRAGERPPSNKAKSIGSVREWSEGRKGE